MQAYRLYGMGGETVKLMNQSYTNITRTQWVMSFVRNRLPHYLFDHVNDVCQEIMIKLMRADERQGTKVENYGYIKQTSMSVMIDFMRKHKNSQITDSFDDQLHDYSNPQDNPENIIHHQKLLELVNNIILTFPKRCQNTLLLYLRGMKINEIVELTGNNKAMVRNDIYRSKEKLINALNNKGIQYEI